MPWDKDFKKDVETLAAIDKAVMGSMQKGTDAAATILAAAVRAGARVDTGELLSEIGPQTYTPKQKNKKATRVTLGPFYRKFLEEGTRHMQPYPFIRPAYAAVKGQLEKAVAAPIDEAVKQAVK